jgi:hypothetical protein
MADWTKTGGPHPLFRRPGRFALPRDFILQEPALAQAIQREVLIILADGLDDGEGIAFVGYSELFDELSGDSPFATSGEAPEYKAIVWPSTGRIGFERINR